MTNNGVSYRIDDCVIRISGHIDRHTVPGLMRTLDIGQLCDERFGVDFSEVVKIDTAGLAWILKIMAQGKQAGQAVDLIAVPPALLNLAAISGVESLLLS